MAALEVVGEPRSDRNLRFVRMIGYPEGLACHELVRLLEAHRAIALTLHGNHSRQPALSGTDSHRRSWRNTGHGCRSRQVDNQKPSRMYTLSHERSEVFPRARFFVTLSLGSAHPQMPAPVPESPARRKRVVLAGCTGS